MTITTWALIPCSKTKAEHACTAREMYWPSAMFRGAWRVAEARGEQPLILSARYGLLWPSNVIEPYDRTLLRMPQWERDVWRVQVVLLLRDTVQPGDRVVSYLPAIYAAGILDALRRHGCEVQEPLKGLGQGRRLAWFRQQLRQAS